MSGTTVVAEGLAGLLVDVGRLELLEGNPRRGDVGAVAKSLARFGQRKPIVARRTTSKRAKPGGTVIAGNHTLLAARELGWDQVAVVWVDDDETTAKAFALADNRTAELGSNDDEALAAMIAEVLAADQELLADASFVEDDLTALLAQIDAKVTPAKLNDPDDAPPLPVTPVTQVGDSWMLGPHRLICGDSTGDAIASICGDARAQMVWTDPPYGVDYGAKNRFLNSIGRSNRIEEDIQNDARDLEALQALLRGAFEKALEVCVPGAVWFVAAPAGPPYADFLRVLLDFGIYRQGLVWLKDRGIFGRSDYHYGHENLCYGWVPNAGHRFPPDQKGTSVWSFPSPRANDVHPTMKPVALIAHAVTRHTASGETVLDPSAGSGSTLIACHDTNRIARLVELDPHYCDVICKRYQQHTGTIPTRNDTPHDFTTDTP